LFFADEPTAALDWARGKQVVQLLCDAAHNRKAAVFMVSHDSRLLSWRDRVYQLEDGHCASRKAIRAPTARPWLPHLSPPWRGREVRGVSDS